MKGSTLFKKTSKHEKTLANENSSKCSLSSMSIKSKKSGSFISSFKRVMSGKKQKGSDTTIQEFNLPREDKSNSSIAGQFDSGMYEVEMKSDLYEKKSHFDKITEDEQEFIKNEINTPRTCDNISIINLRKSNFDENKFKQIQEMALRLKESEDNLIHIITKYIRDQNFQSELLDVVSKHTKLQYEVEFKTSTVINRIWVQQWELVRGQERDLQDTLNALVKQNRKLHSENETLFRKHEKSIKKLHAFTEFDSMQDLKDNFKCNCDKEFEYVLKHNEKLQRRLDTYSQQLERYENELSLSQRQCDTLNKQLRASNTDIQFLKAKLERSKTDYDLELVSLNVKLQNSEQTLKQTMEIGENLMVDLKDIGKQFKNIPLAIDWSKVKGNESSSIDLLNLCRSYISEFSKELISVAEKNINNEKSMHDLTSENLSLKESLNQTKLEIENLNQKKIETSSIHSMDIAVYEGKIKSLENECKIYEEKINKSISDLNDKFKDYSELILKYDMMNNEIVKKEKQLDEKTTTISNLTNENTKLNSELENLQKIIKNHGNGDHSKVCKEAMMKVQSEYYQLLKDKQLLLDQVHSMKQENKGLCENQHKSYQQSLKQKEHVQVLNQELKKLRQKLDMEHQTLISLQRERKKYLDEKTALRNIFQHMKLDIERMQQLEGSMANISNEANRLALIADFNKQIGEKLKHEVAQRDNTITELRGNMEKLNTLQMENAKEKLSLCYELTEVCNIKEQLSEILSTEVQKNQTLCEAQKDLESTATNQVKKLQEKENAERNTLRDLFSELKKVVEERDRLLILQEKHMRDIKEMKSNILDVQKKFDTLVAKTNKKDQKILQLSENIKSNDELYKQTEVKFVRDVKEFQKTISSLENNNKQLSEQNSELQNTIHYLQNNTQKLHNDLNEARRQEKDAIDNAMKLESVNKNLEVENIQFQKSIQTLVSEKNKLMAEIEYVNSLCEKVLSDFETSIKTNGEKEEAYKKEIDEYKTLISRFEVEFELSQKNLEMVQKELYNLKTDQNTQNIANEGLQTICELRQENKSLIKDMQYLENKFKQLEEDIDTKTFEIKKAEKFLQDMSEENLTLKHTLEQTMQKHAETNKSLNNEILSLNKQLIELSEALENEKRNKVSLELYNEMSDKYLSSTAELLNKKQALQETLTILHESQEAVKKFKRENQDLTDQITKALLTLNREKVKMEELTREKENFKKQCLNLENELKETQISALSDEELTHYKSVESRAKMLKMELDSSYDMIVNLKEDISNLQQQITNLEFQRCDLTLKLHESEGHYETEKIICDKLRQANQHILAAILRMKEDGKVGTDECNELLRKIQEEEHNLTKQDLQ